MLTDLERVRALDARVNDVSLTVVGKAAVADLDRPTPCAEWTLRELLAHMTIQHHGFAAAARGGGADEGLWQARTFADPVAAYEASVADVAAAFAEMSGDTMLALPELSAENEFTAAQAATFHLVDGVAHTWDVAKAIGAPVDFDAEVLDGCLEVSLSIPTGDEVRLAPGAVFGPVQPAAEDAPTLDRIVAALGRAPDWTPPAGR